MRPCIILLLYSKYLGFFEFSYKHFHFKKKKKSFKEITINLFGKIYIQNIFKKCWLIFFSAPKDEDLWHSHIFYAGLNRLCRTKM